MIKNGKRLPPKRHKCESIGSVLDNCLKNLGLDFTLKQYKVIEKWDDIVGKQVAEVTKPLHFKFKVLFVHVDNHVWLHQLVFLEQKIIETINRYCTATVVDRIFFKIKTDSN